MNDTCARRLVPSAGARMLFGAALVIFSALLAVPAIATTWYVNNSPTGCGGSGCSNSNSGLSETQALADPGGCISHMSGGDTCLIMDGGVEYTTNAASGGSNVPVWNFCKSGMSGTAAAPTTITNYPGDTPTLCRESGCPPPSGSTSNPDSGGGIIIGLYSSGTTCEHFLFKGLHIVGGLWMYSENNFDIGGVRISHMTFEESSGGCEGNRSPIRLERVQDITIDHNSFDKLTDQTGCSNSSASFIKNYCAQNTLIEFNTFDTRDSTDQEHSIDLKNDDRLFTIRYNKFIGPEPSGINATITTGSNTQCGAGQPDPGSNQVYGNLFIKQRINQAQWDANSHYHHNTFANVDQNGAFTIGQARTGAEPGHVENTTNEDNLYHNAQSFNIVVDDDTWGDEFPAEYNLDHNVYGNAPFRHYVLGASVDYNNLTAWQSATGLDADSQQLACDLNCTDIEANNCFQVSGGPCATASTTGGPVGYGALTTCVGHTCSDGPDCGDGLDNDHDGLIDANDPGCADLNDTSELGTTACDNGNDDDGDGATDASDPGCSGPSDTSELGSNACDDGIDNDGDGQTDYPDDAGCSSIADVSEAEACSDGIDNDGDGAIDYPADTGCDSASDSDERGTGACDNGVDDDGDGLVDAPNDPGCSGPGDPSELGTTACDDGIDNDGDTFVDVQDPGCDDPWDASELGSVECDDGVDNDGDGQVDYPGDSSCPNPAGVSESTVADECVAPRAGWILCDGFENGTLDFWANDLNTANGALKVEAASAAMGAFHSRMSYESGNGAWGMRFFADHPLLASPGEPLTEVYVRVRVRYSEINGSLIMTTASFENWSADYPGGLSWAPYLATLQTDESGEFEILVKNRTNGSETATVFSQNVGGPPAVASVATWHTVQYRLKLNTPGLADGILEMWVDGTKKLSRADVDFRGSYTAKGWNTMMLRGSDADGAIPTGGYEEDVDGFVASHVPIDNVGSTDGPPGTPPNFHRTDGP